MQPWRACRNWPQVKTYKENDVQQPLAILKYVHVQAEEGNSVTAVIGADGLDKKARLFRERDLVDWHASVPELVAAWKRSPKEFLKELKKLPSFQTGKLTRKELWCVFAASSFPALRDFGETNMEYGPGAAEGSKLFLHGILPKPGDEMMKDIGR